MVTAYFKDDKGQTLIIEAPTFTDAYQQAVDQDFYIFDYEFEEWNDDNNN